MAEATERKAKLLTVGDLLGDCVALGITKDTVILLASDAEGNEVLPFEGMDHTAAYDTKAKQLAWDFGPDGEVTTTKRGGRRSRVRRALVLYPCHGGMWREV